jgi:hypothetical protein
MFLDYLALVVLIAGITLLIYVFFAIHDIPARIAHKRNHPHEEAIHVGCWLSLFTLHAIWPFVFMWAVSYRPKLEVEVVETGDGTAGDGTAGNGKGHAKRLHTTINVDPNMSLEQVRGLVASVTQRIEALEREQSGGAAPTAAAAAAARRGEVTS